MIFLKDPMKRARYRIPGESTFTRRRGAQDRAAGEDFFPRRIGRDPTGQIYLVHGVNVKRNRSWMGLKSVKKTTY